VQSVDVVAGEIIITYGNEAHDNIQDMVLILTPFLSIDESVVWQCGLSTTGTDLSLSAMDAETSNSATTVLTQYLPSACRA
jgi:hypothetical protein